jgi:hypothetical protein
MMSPKTICSIAFAILAVPAVAFPQTYSPWVTLSVTTPDGETIERTARDSSVATITLKDGTTYEFRPTIHDEPFSKVTIAVFKAATATESTVPVGEVVVNKGAKPIALNAKPSFRISVPRIDAIGPKQSS